MSVNLLDMLIAAILALSVISGMYRGFLTAGLHTFGFIGSWFIAKAGYLKLASLAISNKTLMAILSKYLEADTFFASSSIANMSVTDAVAGGNLESIADTIAEKLPFIKQAFINNVTNNAFKDLNIWSLKDYLDQTVFSGLFNIIAFLIIFAVVYALIVLIVNMINSIVNFPVLKVCDRLFGGAFGLVRGVIVVMIVLTLVPMILNSIVPDLVTQLESGSRILPVIKSVDYLSVEKWINAMLGA